MKNFKFVNFMFMIKLYTFLILGIVFYCALNTSSLVVFAENISNFVEIKNNSDILSKETIYKIKSLTKEMFGDVNVSSNEYLYNLDGSSDYIYVEFENSGYAIYYKETMELLEYSAQGYLSYPTDSIKFYGGPSMYLTKQNDLFVDTLTGDILNISSKSANLYSNEVREMLLSNYEHREKTPFNFDYSSICDNSISEDAMSKQLYEDSSLIKQEISGLEDIEEDIPTYNRDALIRVIDGTYIPNYNYFLSEPLHGQNQTGTCGAVAAQLLLSYNNYYNDRRIIEDKYLNGGESEPEKSPNLCSNPMLMNKHTLGTRGYYENGSDDTNSYFSYVVSKIPANAYSYQVTNGLNNILMERNELISGRIDYTLTSSRIFDPSDITSEIDSGRPVIILMQESLGGTDHYVVAYGYRNYLYPNSTTSYLGYITHFGWKSSGAVNYLNIWVNSSWCHTYYSLEINHTHNYTIDTGNNINGQYRELKCGECGHRTVDTLYSVNSTGAITGLKYSNVPNSIVIPTQINNTNVNSIGANAFLNCTNLQSVTFEAGSQLTSIGYNAC